MPIDIVSVSERLVRDPVTHRIVDETPITIDPTDPAWARLIEDGDVQLAPARIVAAQIQEPAPIAVAETEEPEA